MEENDLNKLPKWARYRIEKLEADINHYHQQLAQIEGEADTDTFIGHGYLDCRQPLPKGINILFQIDDEYLGVRVNEDHIELNSSSRLITIQPRASNSVWVRL